MPSPFSYKNDSDKDQRASPKETAKRLQDQEQQSGYDRDFAGITDPEQFAKDGKSGDLNGGVRDAEDAGNIPPIGGWQTNVNGKGSTNTSRWKKALTFTKKRSPIIALIGILGVGGGLLAGFLGPASMLVSVMQNVTTTNDTSSTSFQRRIMKVLGNVTTGDPSGICANSTSINCKMGRISNSALTRLSKKGIVPYDNNGPMVTKGKLGYPSKNPTGYTIDLNDGSKPKNVLASDLPGFLSENPKIASKVLGVGGAFNLRLKTWAGKYITQKFFNRYNLKRNGGLADGTTKTTDYESILDKLRKNVPGLDNLDGIKGGVDAKIGKHLDTAKKGGAGYTLAVAGCIAAKAPGYIAAGVAAVQLAQIMPIIMNVILSPASKLQASGVDSDVKFNSEDMSAIGLLLTTKVARASDGKKTSALDSPYLQSAMGINKNKLPISKNYTPGYSILTNPIITGAHVVDEKTKVACNGLMSPASMYTAMAVDAAVTVAASSTLIGGVIKVAAGWAIAQVTGEVIANVAGDAAIAAVKEIASNDMIPKAQGEDLGDVLGISASSFFASGGMAHNLPVLTMDQVPEFAALQKDNEDFQREMDIASLSPFDTSSRYTFMGSIVYNMHMATLTSGSYGSGFLSMLSNAIKVPFGLSSNVSALGFSDTSCGYASDFDLDLNTTDPGKNPAITDSGLPCTGITGAQASMSTKTALDLIKNEGWLDESKPIEDDSTIGDLLESGYIKSGTPLADAITTCSDASTGDYLYNAASCTVDSTSADPSSVKSGYSTNEVTATGEGLKNGKSMEAIAVFLLDYQEVKMINDEDGVEYKDTSSSDSDNNSETDSQSNSESTSLAPFTHTDSLLSTIIPAVINTKRYVI